MTTLNPSLLDPKPTYKRLELCRLLGISGMTLWRLEQQGRIRSLPAFRHKLYPRAEVERFLTLPKPEKEVRQ